MLTTQGLADRRCVEDITSKNAQSLVSQPHGSGIAGGRRHFMPMVERELRQAAANTSAGAKNDDVHRVFSGRVSSLCYGTTACADVGIISTRPPSARRVCSSGPVLANAASAAGVTPKVSRSERVMCA
jgi:hypothetical protein